MFQFVHFYPPVLNFDSFLWSSLVLCHATEGPHLCHGLSQHIRDTSMASLSGCSRSPSWLFSHSGLLVCGWARGLGGGGCLWGCSGLSLTSLVLLRPVHLCSGAESYILLFALPSSHPGGSEAHWPCVLLWRSPSAHESMQDCVHQWAPCPPLSRQSYHVP